MSVRTCTGSTARCGAKPAPAMRDADGTEYRVPPVFNGAEGRYEDWTWLRMLEREWLRPVARTCTTRPRRTAGRPLPQARIKLGRIVDTKTTRYHEGHLEKFLPSFLIG